MKIFYKKIVEIGEIKNFTYQYLDAEVFYKFLLLSLTFGNLFSQAKKERKKDLKLGKYA